MKKFTKKEALEYDLAKSEYFVNQLQIQKEYSSLKKQRNIAYILAVIVFLGSLRISYYALSITKQAKVVDKIVYMQDGSGGLTLMGSASGTKLNIKNDKLIRNQLAGYIMALYSNPLDKAARQENANKVVSMTSTAYFRIYPQQVLQNIYKTVTDPIDVKIRTAGEIAPGVWGIDYSTFTQDKKLHDYKATITFHQEDETNASVNVDFYNPLQIVITNVNNEEMLN